MRLGQLLIGSVVVVGVQSGCIQPDASELEQDEGAVTAPVAPGDSLRAAAAHAGRRVGTAVAYTPLVGEPAYAALLAAEYDSVTPENELKWGSVQPTDPFHTSYAKADAIVARARAAGQTIKGHALIWHSQLPPFITDATSPLALALMSSSHIVKTVNRYRNTIRAWDVVNEAIADNGTPRDTVFLRKLGPGYIASAFWLARLADWDARLYYNDYNIDAINPKSDAVYALVRGLVQQHVPIDGVGFQMHLEAHNAPSLEALVANLQRFADLGLTVNISELDVRTTGVTGDAATKLAVQKQVYHRVVAACLQVARCEGITTWGLTDRYSWIDGVFGADDPLPFDDAGQRKPAYHGMIDGFVDVPPDEPGAAPNLVANASFEAGTAGWIAWAGTLDASTADAHTGLRSVRSSARTATWQGPVLDVRPSVRAGWSYDVTAWAKLGAGGVASDAVRLSSKARCAGGADQYSTLGSATATTGGWVALASTLAVPSCALEELVIYVEGPAAGVELFVDDVAVRPQPGGGTGPNLVANPGFEAGATGWFGFGIPAVVATAVQAHGGAQSGLAANRTASWQGPATSLLGLALAGTHDATAWVRLDGAPASEVYLTLKARCGTTESYTRVGTANATDTGWALLSGPLVVPACALDELTAYFEGPAAGVSLYVDDVAVRRVP